MNTKVKVGIAAAIVAALVALIVLDQKTTPKDDTAGKTPGGESINVGGPTANGPSQRLPDEEINNLLDKAKKEFGGDRTTKPNPIKGEEKSNEKMIPSSTGEEYVIKDGDNLQSIAKTKYGNASFIGMILEANPGLKPASLRIGQK